MNECEYEKIETTNTEGAPVLLLVRDGELDRAIPLLDLAFFDLPIELETRLRHELWSVGIREWRDIAQRGAEKQLMAAVRSTLKLAVTSFQTLARQEMDYLREIYYE